MRPGPNLMQRQSGPTAAAGHALQHSQRQTQRQIQTVTTVRLERSDGANDVYHFIALI